MRDVEFVKSVLALDQLPTDRLPEVAFIGPSNVGKSSLINTLLGRPGLARTSTTPGRTQALNFFRVEGRFHVVDLPGYGYARVPKAIQDGFLRLVEDYLARSPQLCFVALLLDCRREPSERDAQLVRWLEESGVQRAFVLTKADKLSKTALSRQESVIAKSLGEGHPILAFSAETGQGKQELWRLVEAAVGLRKADRAGGRRRPA